MKNRFMNHHLVQVNTLDVYCLSRDWFGALFDTLALTSVLRPPPPPQRHRYI